MLLGPAERHQAVLRDAAPAAAGGPSTVRQPPHSCNAVHPLVNRPVRPPFLAQHPPFRAVKPGKQHQNRAGPDKSHREYQCDRFLGAHTSILCLGECQVSEAHDYSCRPRPGHIECQASRPEERLGCCPSGVAPGYPGPPARVMASRRAHVLRFSSATVLMRRTARLRTSRGHRPVPPARQGGLHRSARLPVRAGCPAASAPKPRRGHREGRPG